MDLQYVFFFFFFDISQVPVQINEGIFFFFM